MKGIPQRVMHCPCGNAKVLALGMCATCYTLKRQDEEYFGGLREAVLERDGYRCRVCDASGRDKRSIIVHHRKPGRSVMDLMVSLCPGCHAKIHRTKAVLSAMPPLPLELWREQHPKGEALLIERAFGIGVSALTEAIAIFGEKLNVQPA